MKTGLSAAELFTMGLSYNDFLVLDTHFSEINKDEIDLGVDIGKGIVLKTPIISSPMDTVSEAAMCIALALEGGIGTMHYNNTPDEQAAMVLKVKKAENGFIDSPHTVSPDTTIAELVELTDRYGISSYPVTRDGKPDGVLVGLITKYDFSRKKHRNLDVKDRMVKDLVKLVLPFKTENHLSEANSKLLESRLSILPIVDSNDRLKYIVTRSDIEKNEDYPLATKDENKQLRVLFAMGTRPDDRIRAELCFDAGADGVIIDTSQGFTSYSIECIRWVASNYPDKLIIAGNVSTKEACDKLSEAGADVIRVGQGPGAACTTQGVLGKGRAQAMAVYECSKGSYPTIADGGIKGSGDIYKAIAIGAKAVMLGSLFAGCKESPGEIREDPAGNIVKDYRGMGSTDVLKEKTGVRGYSVQAQGISGSVAYRGSVHEFVPLLVDTLRLSMHAENCPDIGDLHMKLYNEDLRFERMSVVSLEESNPHSFIRKN